MFIFFVRTYKKLCSIIIIAGTNERCSSCSNNRKNTNTYILDYVFVCIFIAVFVSFQKCDGMMQPEYKKFCVDPQLTSFEVLQNLLCRAFNVKG